MLNPIDAKPCQAIQNFHHALWSRSNILILHEFAMFKNVIMTLSVCFLIFLIPFVPRVLGKGDSHRLQMSAAMQVCCIACSLPLAGNRQICTFREDRRPATSSSKLWCCQAGTEVKPNIQKMLVAFNCRHGSQDPYASGFAEAPFLLRRLKHTNIGAPSAGGRAHCSQKHRRVLTMEHSLPPSIGVVNFVPPLMHSSFTWTANKGRPLACGAEKPRPMQKM